jgi:hypothetical protein
VLSFDDGGLSIWPGDDDSTTTVNLRQDEGTELLVRKKELVSPI